MASDAAMRWLGFSCIAACLLVSSCASQAPVAEDPGCKDESCLLPVLMGLSTPDAQRYFFVRRAVARGFDVQGASRPFREMYATLASFVGEYEEADRVYPMPAEDMDAVAGGYVTAMPAADTVRALSRATRAVFVNEAHASARTRAAIYTLLRPLREEGYGYLALEGLTTKPADAATTCSDAEPFDDALANRGYPVRKTGFYAREPIYAEIIREALRLGFKLVAYESADPAATTIEHRELGLARNLACVFKDDPQAKLLVIAGFGHVAEATDAIVPGGMMAARFKALTSIDPLSIDTTTLLHAGVETFHFGEFAKERSPSQGFVLVDAMGRLYGSDSYDLVLLTPDFAGREDDEHSWLALDGARKRMSIPAAGCGHSRPCLVEAFPAEEESGVPEDSCMLENDEETCPLFLPKGEFRVEYSGLHGELGRMTISSPAP